MLSKKEEMAHKERADIGITVFIDKKKHTHMSRINVRPKSVGGFFETKVKK